MSREYETFDYFQYIGDIPIVPDASAPPQKVA